MSSTIRTACALAVIVIANFIFRPQTDVLVEHNKVPDSKSRRAYFDKYLEAARPQIVLLGNSMLRVAVDDKLFSTLTASRTIKLTQEASASALWYLAIKKCNAQVPSQT